MTAESPQHETDSTRVVLLKHTLADLTWHYDWMFELPNLEVEHRLLTFRTSSHPAHWLSNNAQMVTKLPHHREKYLTYEGEVSGERGHVERVDSGIGKCLIDTVNGILDIKLSWVSSTANSAEAAPETQYRGEFEGDDLWKVWKL